MRDGQMRYAAIVRREGRATLAEFPDAPGCQTFAEQGEEIAAVAQEALEGWLEAHLVSGDVPPPVSKIAPKVSEGASVLWVDVPARLAARVALRRARHEAGLTQSQLAKRAGVTQPQVAKLESPDANPTLETLEKVAAALGVRLFVSFDTKIEREAGKAARELTTELRSMSEADVLKIARLEPTVQPVQRTTYAVVAKKTAKVGGRASPSSAKKTARIGGRAPLASMKSGSGRPKGHGE